MGFDINVYLLEGIKIPLDIAFEYKLLDPAILESDDYQIIDDPDCRNEIIERHVISESLKTFLLGYENWNLYILTSSQNDCNISKSYLFLYTQKRVCCQGRAPDYATDVIEPTLEWSAHNLYKEHYLHALTNVSMPETFEWRCKLHWVVESSW
jgi:hypothetical protein